MNSVQHALWIALFVGVVAAAVASAKDNSDSEHRPKTKDPVVKRSQVFKLENHSLKVTGAKPATTNGSRLFFTFSTDGVPSFRVSFVQNSLPQNSSGDRDESPDVAGFSFRLALVGLLEFTSNDTAPVFDLSQRVEKRVWLEGHNRHWSNIKQSDQTDPVTGVRAFTFSTSFAAENAAADPLVVTIDVHVAEDALKSNNVTLRSNAMKFDLTVSNFSFAKPASFLAVLAKLQSKALVAEHTKQDDDPSTDSAKAVEIGAAEGKLAWAEQVVARLANRTASCPVQSSVLSTSAMSAHADGGDSKSEADGSDDDRNHVEANARWLAFTFQCAEHPTTLTWDPEAAAMDAKLDVGSIPSNNPLNPSSAVSHVTASTWLLLTAAAAMLLRVF